MAISTYNELVSALSEWLVRSDLPAVIPTFIANAEATFRRDPRIRQLVISTLPINAASVGLPGDFKRMESVSLNGPSPYYWELDIVSPGSLSKWIGPSGTNRPPRVAAIVESSNTLYVAPVPNQAYDCRLAYWRTIPSLGDTTPSNWLLAEHPDIYLYGALIESAPYLKDDERVPLWRAEYERRIQELDAYADQSQFSGSLTMGGIAPIG